MKTIKFACLLVVLLAALMSVSVFASGKAVDDQADLLDAEAEATLSHALEQIHDTYGIEVAFVTVDSCGDVDAMRLAEITYEDGGYGGDGVLLLVSISDRQWAVYTLGGGYDAFPDSALDEMELAMVPHLKNDEFALAATAYAQICEEKIDAWDAGGRVRMSEPIGIGEVLIVVALGFGIALIVLLVMKSQLTSVKPAKSARAYVDRDRMELTERTDRFLYRTVHSTPKAKSNSSGGGRSGGRSGSF